MCIPRQQPLAAGPTPPVHNCIDSCPVCWFLSELNIRHLAAGGAVDLGVLSELITAAQAGCEFALFLARMLLNSERGSKFVADAKLEVKVEYPDVNRPPELRELHFNLQNPMDGLFGGSGGFAQDFEFLSYSFPMGIFAKGGPVEQYVKQKPPDPNPASADAYNTARTWISDCLKSHDGCPKNDFEKSEMPTRVLDVSADCGPGKVKLHTSNGQKGHYAALSYCWGSTRQVMTTRALLESFKEGIEVEKLPKSLQDAISVARELEIKYIWIDSLCIIQDDEEDKSKELVNMSQIYKNAVVTVFAAAAQDCGDGFLEERAAVKDRISFTFDIPYLKLSESDDIFFEGVAYICADREMGYHIKDFRDEPINTRAWTLQESWLSPRLLIYGSGPLKWQCLSKNLTHGLGNDEHPDMTAAHYFKNRGMFFTSNVEPDVSTALAALEINPGAAALEMEKDMRLEWERLVFHYSCRSLSVPTDKLPALSAIAAEFHRVTGDKYLAGLWRRDLPWGLLWLPQFGSLEEEQIDPAEIVRAELSKKREKKPKKKEKEEGKKEKWTSRAWKHISSRKDKKNQVLESGPQLSPESGSELLKPPSAGPPHPPYIAPSWSPASYKNTITFDTRLTQLSTTICEIHSASTTPTTPIVPFGSITSGSISLTGPMQFIGWRNLLERFVICIEGSPHVRWDYIMPDYGHRNPDFVNAAVVYGQTQNAPLIENEQYYVGDKITSYLGLHDPNASLPVERPRPLNSRSEDLRAVTPKYTDLGKEVGPGFWFLEVTWNETPTGLVLLENPDGTFRRTGFFKCGRNGGSLDGLATDLGPRRWDWDMGLRMYKICLV